MRGLERYAPLTGVLFVVFVVLFLVSLVAGLLGPAGGRGLCGRGAPLGPVVGGAAA